MPFSDKGSGIFLFLDQLARLPSLGQRPKKLHSFHHSVVSLVAPRRLHSRFPIRLKRVTLPSIMVATGNVALG